MTTRPPQDSDSNLHMFEAVGNKADTPGQPPAGVRSLVSLVKGIFGFISPTATKTVFVSPSGLDANDGSSWARAKKTVQAAVTAAAVGDCIYISPGTYVEAVSIPLAKTNLTLIGIGTRLSASIAPSAANAKALAVHADDVTIVNLDLVTNGTGNAMRCTGRRFHDVGCKFEGDYDPSAGSPVTTSVGYVIGPGANSTIHVTEQNGSDSLSEGAEFAWLGTGVVLQGSDYGATTENRFRNAVFHNIGVAHFEEASLNSDPTAQFRSLEITGCKHMKDELGAAPTGGYVLLNDSNSNTGHISGGKFPAASNAHLALSGTGVTWCGDNAFTNGFLTAPPS